MPPEFLEIVKAAAAGLAFSLPVVGYMRATAKDRGARLERIEKNTDGLRADIDGLAVQLREQAIAAERGKLEAERRFVARDEAGDIIDGHLHRRLGPEHGWRADHDPDRRR